MKNTKNIYLKREESKKDKEIKKYRRRSKNLLLIIIILGGVVITQMGQDIFQKWTETTSSNSVRNQINNIKINVTNKTIINQEGGDASLSISKGIIFIMERIFTYPGGFWTKFFIFLGIIYLIQVMFSLIFDVIELILLVFVAVKRLIVWIYRKITGKDKRDKQLEKIMELK